MIALLFLLGLAAFGGFWAWDNHMKTHAVPEGKILIREGWLLVIVGALTFYTLVGLIILGIGVALIVKGKKS